MTGRLSRLARLEAAAGVVAINVKDTFDRSAERAAAWQVMQATMSPEHAELVLQAYAAGFHETSSAGFNSPAGRLLRRCLDAICSRRRQAPYSAIPDEIAYAMPPELAEVYLNHPAALPLHDCADCGFTLPHGFFERCPLCGGSIGWYAYFKRHRDTDGAGT